MQFVDRRDAGARLAGELASLAGEHPVVVALPRGGVPVGAEVARALGAPLEILAVRKLGAPGNPELGVGAIAEDGTAILDPRSAEMLGMTQSMLDETVAQESRELGRRVERYRDGRAAVDLRGRTVIITDDGLATGLTDLAAVRAVRERGARTVVVAVPVGSKEAVSLLAEEADRVICLTVPEQLFGVGIWYEDFTPVSDEDVVALLAGTENQPAAASHAAAGASDATELSLQLDGVRVSGDLTVPASAGGLVLFAHGSGSSRSSPRNRAVAGRLNDAGLATLLFDLLDPQEAHRRDLVFDIPLLAERLEALTRRVLATPELRSLPLGYFGASTGAGAALQAAAALGRDVAAVVSRGGRPDLAGEHLASVRSPTLLIVGSRDTEVLELNRRAAGALSAAHELVVVEDAGHLFEEPGALERVAELSIGWFRRYLISAHEQALSGVG